MTKAKGPRPPGAASPAVSERPPHDMQSVHDSLKDLIDSLRAERERRLRPPGEPSAPAPPAVPGQASAPAGPPAAPVPEVADLEKRRLALELTQARAELERRRGEAERLQSRLSEMEAEKRRLSDEYVVVEEQNTELASLLVAVQTLHGSLDREEILGAVHEIVVNMVGSEELGIYELDPASRQLELAQGFGLADSRPERIALGAGTIGRTAETGSVFVAGRGASCEDPDLTACLPLRAAGRVVGAIAIWRLLGHKSFLTDLDRRLFEVLETHAGRSLYLARLHGRRAAPAG